jgi:hypothetical protein
MTEHATTLEVDDRPEDWDQLVEERGWGDGLPVVPATPDRVEAFVAATGRAGDDVIGRIPPAWGVATVEKVAVNAVMAGATPRLAPLVMAALETLVDPAFNLYGIQATTNPVAPVMLVSGRAVEDYAIACGSGCLGPGFPANARLGRALRMVLLNLGGARPGLLDRATHGAPAKFAAVAGEYAQRNPWDPFNRARGLEESVGAVTALGATSLINCLDHTSTSGADLMTTFAGTLMSVGTNTTMLGGPIVILMSPEHAAIFDRDGYEPERIARELYERAVMPAEHIPPLSLAELRWKRGNFSNAVDGPQIHALDRPDALSIFVTGGDGPHSIIASSFGVTELVTRQVPEPTVLSETE